MVQHGRFGATRCGRVARIPGGVGPSIHHGAMTTASVSSATGATSVDAARGRAVRSTPSPGSRLVLDRELIGVRRHDLELAGRVPDERPPARRRLRRHARVPRRRRRRRRRRARPGARVRGATRWCPLLPAVQPTEPGGHDVSATAPFDEVVGEAVEDVSRLLTHVEHPDEMRGLVLHLGGRMLMVYADLWELRVTLLP